MQARVSESCVPHFVVCYSAHLSNVRNGSKADISRSPVSRRSALAVGAARAAAGAARAAVELALGLAGAVRHSGPVAAAGLALLRLALSAFRTAPGAGLTVGFRTV